MLPHPSIDEFVHILQSCTKDKHPAPSLFLHAFLQRSGLSAHTVLGNRLVSLLVEVGSMHNAEHVFDELRCRDHWSWNALITCYTKFGKPQQALTLYQEMQKRETLHPSGHAFVALLKACAQLKDWKQGLCLHCEIGRSGLLEGNICIASALVDMYVSCGLLAKAQQSFDKLTVRDAVMWTGLMSGYLDHGLHEEALICFEKMQSEGVLQDSVVTVCGLKACGSTRATSKGQQIHAEIERHGLYRGNAMIGNTLVDMYAKFGLLSIAREVFERLPARNVVTWNALITGYAENNHGEEALMCFDQMRLEGVVPDAVTYMGTVKACCSRGATDSSGAIYTEIERSGFLGSSPVMCSTLIDMYAKSGLFSMAEQVFDKISARDVILWTALMTGYAEHGLDEAALHCLEQMQVEGVSPNAVTFVSGLKACGSAGAIDKGGEIHAELERRGLLKKDLILGNSLVDMYVKCGLLSKAQDVFDTLSVRDTISWNALVAGYAQIGESEDVLHILDRMLGDNIKPDPITFVVVLSGFLRTGLYKKSEMYFETMNRNYGVVPTIKHHTCLVDLFCRAGHVDEAASMMLKMPFRPNMVVWRTLLSACKRWEHFLFGKQVFEHAVTEEGKDASAYVLMSHVYATGDL